MDAPHGKGMTKKGFPCNVLDVKPKLLDACEEFVRELISSVSAADFIAILAETSSTYDADIKSSKKQLKRLGHDILNIEKGIESLGGEKQKSLSKLSGIDRHESQLWNVLNSHVADTAESLERYKVAQKRYNEGMDVGGELRGQSLQLHDKLSGMAKSLHHLKDQMEQLAQEKVRLQELVSSRANETKLRRLGELKKKLKVTVGDRSTNNRNVLKELAESNAKLNQDEKMLRHSIADVKKKISQSVAEASLMAIRVEGRESEMERTDEMIQEKLKLVQRFCDAQMYELKSKLDAESEENSVELKLSIQQLQHLENVYNERCLEQKAHETDLVRLRATTWQGRDERRDGLVTEINRLKDQCTKKKRQIKKIKKKVKKCSAMNKRNLLRKTLDEPPNKKQKFEFKKPAPPPKADRRRSSSTNALFDQLRNPTGNKSSAIATDHELSVIPAAQKSSATRTRTPVIVRAPSMIIASTTLDDGETSIFTMSSIESLASLERRLEKGVVPSDTEDDRFSNIQLSIC